MLARRLDSFEGTPKPELRRVCSSRASLRMEHQVAARSGDCIPDIALEFVFGFIDDPRDRGAISLVCKKWFYLDNLTRKDVTLACCYAAKPQSLSRRFKRLESVKLKGKPRAAMFRLIPEDWGGYAEPWVKELTVNCQCLKSIHFRRMIVTDEDLLKLAKERGHMLQELKLDKCSGFSTLGLEAVTRSCRSLRVLFLDESSIEDCGGKWLHELALHNSSLEVLNFSATLLQVFDLNDLETLVANCKSLVSLKVNDVELDKLTSLLKKTSALRELGGVLISQPERDQWRQNEVISLPKFLTSLLGLWYTGDDEGDNSINSLIQPLASGLKKLDLQCAFLSVEGHCQLLRHCTNLEVLEVLNAVGDEGLDVVANCCKNLRRLRVERGDRDVQQGYITQKGLMSIAQGCPNLEYIAVYISDIDNPALVAIGEGCPKLRDFRLVLLEEDSYMSDNPLDDGVTSLMRGCSQLIRFALYLRPGLLTDRGMQYIGRFGIKLKWALFGLLGETDDGLSLFAEGCPNLEKLEMRDCVFSEAGIARAVLKMKRLKYVWVQGYRATNDGRDLLGMERPHWNIEFIPEQTIGGKFQDQEPQSLDVSGRQPAQFLAYRSLAGRRRDNPETVLCLS